MPLPSQQTQAFIIPDPKSTDSVRRLNFGLLGLCPFISFLPGVPDSFIIEGLASFFSTALKIEISKIFKIRCW